MEKIKEINFSIKKGWYSTVIVCIVGFLLLSRAYILPDNLNREIVIEDDTLLIVNYSTMFNTYTLSNGLEVHSCVVDSCIIKKSIAEKEMQTEISSREE